MKNRKKSQRGFSMIEMLISVAILVTIAGAVLAQIANLQMRYHTEENRLNTVEETREFVDQMVRDMHQTAFPHPRLFRLQYTGPQPYAKSTIAAGLVYASPYKVQFEADLDGSGAVQEVVYQLIDQSGSVATSLNNCPCIVQRGQVGKAPVAPESPNQAKPIFTTEVDNVINPANEPLFRFFDINGNEITSVTSPALPLQFDSTQAFGGTIAQVYSVKISVTVSSRNKDVQTRLKPEVTYTATAEINN